jgi:hypothetical protein
VYSVLRETFGRRVGERHRPRDPGTLVGVAVLGGLASPALADAPGRGRLCSARPMFRCAKRRRTEGTRAVVWS